MCDFAMQQFVVVFCSKFSAPLISIKLGNTEKRSYDKVALSIDLVAIIL
jgi:hypothetical protein